MLSKSALSSARAFGESLAASGIHLTVTPNATIAALVDASRSPWTPNQAALGDILNQGLEIAEIGTAGNAAADSVHTVLVDQIADRLSSLVAPHIAHARTVVSPLVTSMAENVAARVSEFRPSDPSARFSVIKQDIPLLFKETPLEEKFARFAKEEIPAHLPVLNLNPRTVEEIIEICKAGQPDESDEVARFILSVEPDVLKQAWATFFETGSKDALRPDAVVNMNPFARLNFTLIGFLGAAGLEQQPPADLIGQDLSTFRVTIDTMIRWTASIVGLALNNCRASREFNTVVLAYEHSADTVYVDKDVYQKFLDQGGSPDVLMACLLDHDNASSLPALLAVAEQKESAWAEFSAHNARNHGKELSQFMRLLYSAEMREQMQNIDSTEKEYAPDQARYIDTVMKKVDECIACASEEELRDVNRMAMCLVANCRFHFTSAYEILSEIETTCRQAGVAPREAAGAAIMAYVTRFLIQEVAIAK